MKTQRQFSRWLIPLLLLVLATMACGILSGGDEAGDEPEAPAADEQAAGEASADAGSGDPLFDLKQSLVLAMGAQPRDYANLTQYMGDSFEVMILFGNGEQMSPLEATSALQSWLLPPDNHFVYEDIDIQAEKGFDPVGFYSNPQIADFMFSTGWADGTAEALIVIAQNPDGTYYWSGILLAYDGLGAEHPGAAESGGGAADPGASAGRYTDMYDFQTALLDALTSPPRDYNYLQHSFMGAEFAYADLFSIDPQTPANALANMQSHYLPPGNFLTFELSADITARLGQAPPPAAYYLYTYGWGPDGDMGGILLIDRGADGYLYWSGVLTFYEDSAGLPPSAPDPIWAFKKELMSALTTTRNYDGLKSYMGSDFIVMHWNGTNDIFTPQEAVNALFGGYLPAGRELYFNDGADYQAIMGDNPYALYPQFTDFLYARDWGIAGADEAIILIDMQDDGTVYWAGLLYAHDGFGGGLSAAPWMPLPAEFCDDLKTSMETTVGAGTLTYDGTAAFNDHVGGGSGTGCLITITGDGNDFDSWYDHLEDLIAMMKGKGWSEDTHYMAAGATGQGTGFRRDEGLAVIMAGWMPTTTDHCPADQPIGACTFTPEQQIYTFTLHAAMQ